jgi:PST family polysaccharide transporter
MAENAVLGNPVILLAGSLKGGIAKIISQFVNLVTRIVFIAVLSRLIGPEEFGLFTMAMIFLGVFQVIATSGFAQAAIQHADPSEDQLSVLFIFGLGVAIAIAALCCAGAPFAANFYHEPRIVAITVALTPSFILTAAGAVPTALLQRQMRFVEIAWIEALSGLIGSALGIVLALLCYSYWSLVAAAIAWPATATLGAWVLSGWRPRWPRMAKDVVPMLTFGTTLMVNGLVVFASYNSEKFLLGRFWGASVLGIYGRASQISTMPTTLMGQATMSIAFAALSRLQDNPEHQRRYFSSFYLLVNAITVPISLFCFTFAPDVVDTLLGRGWDQAHNVLRMLAPSILVLGMINPTAALLMATGRQNRSLAIGLALVPVCLGAYIAGLPYGPDGVALAYSLAMMLWLLPHLFWAFHRTPVTVADSLLAVAPSLLAGLAGACAALAATQLSIFPRMPLFRLSIEGSVMGGVYLATLFLILKQNGRLEELKEVVRRQGI